ncbi:SRPBCC family protein [Micromonospora sp. NPDC050784]|uniref:SRPBCC family protein n=1 Tax=Micromonospora sp. NPDC050784 TaxID=3364281 RepID=UPI0037BD3463
MTFQLNLDIAAPAAQVFDFVADFTTMPRWYVAVQRVERVTGTRGLGTRYKVYRDLPGGPALNEVSITKYSEGEEVVFTSLSGPTPFTYRYLLRPSPDTTNLILEGTISAAGLTGPAALLGPLAERLFKGGMRDNLGTLKQLLEKSAAPRQPSGGTT